MGEMILTGQKPTLISIFKDVYSSEYTAHNSTLSNRKKKNAKLVIENDATIELVWISLGSTFFSLKKLLT